MSDLKVGDLCLIVGCNTNPRNIGKSGMLRHYMEPRRGVFKRYGRLWKNSYDTPAWIIEGPSIQNTTGHGIGSASEPHLMKISGHKEPEQVTKQEGGEA